MKLLQLRKSIKAKKPAYTRQESHRKSKMDDGKWRRPRGIHSKMRLHQKGKKSSPSPGYGSPRAVEGLHPSGLRPVLVHTLSDVDSVKKEEGIIIGTDVGMRKKVLIAEYAKKKSITILNIKDAEAYVQSVAKQMSERKNAKKKAKSVEKKEEKKAEKGPATPASEEKHAEKKAEPTDEDQKKKEKEEKDKLLTKRV